MQTPQLKFRSAMCRVDYYINTFCSECVVHSIAVFCNCHNYHSHCHCRLHGRHIVLSVRLQLHRRFPSSRNTSRSGCGVGCVLFATSYQRQSSQILEQRVTQHIASSHMNFLYVSIGKPLFLHEEHSSGMKTGNSSAQPRQQKHSEVTFSTTEIIRLERRAFRSTQTLQSVLDHSCTSVSLNHCCATLSSNGEPQFLLCDLICHPVCVPKHQTSMQTVPYHSLSVSSNHETSLRTQSTQEDV